MSGWTEERVAELRRLWKDGVSPTMIGKRLGGVTRNAVCGKAHRLGLPMRRPSRYGDGSARTVVSVPPSRKSATNRTPVQGPEKIETGPESAGVATVLTLGAHMCKWPIGDPSSDGFTFCGARQKVGSVYCAGHHERAHTTANNPTGKKTASVKELIRSLRRYA